MAYYDNVWYVNFGNGVSTGHYAVPLRPQNTAVPASWVVRQATTPAVNAERCFVCIVAGTTADVADATWITTRGAKTVDGTVTWMECTGASAINGDAVNTPNWATVKATKTSPSLGAIIKRNNGESYQICTTAGTMGVTEPAFSDDAGVTTAEISASCVWTCIGHVTAYPGGRAPIARITTACSTSYYIADNTIYIGNNHNETSTAQINLQPTGSGTTMAKLICHNAAGSYPPSSIDITTGANISTLANVAVLIAPSNTHAIYVYGVAFHCGVGMNSQCAISLSGGACWIYLDNCLLDLATTGSTGLTVINMGQGTAGLYTLNNTQMKFGHVAQRVSVAAGVFVWQNTAPAVIGTVMPNVFLAHNSLANIIVLEGLDLSMITGSLISNLSSTPGNTLIKDCKMNTSSVPPQTFWGMICQTSRSNNSAIPYESTRWQYEGIETTETTTIRADGGGAADPSGGQVQARKIVTNNLATWIRPFKAEPYATWSSAVGAAITATVHGMIGTPSALNDEVWMDCEYLGNAGSTLGRFVTTTKANIAATGYPNPADSIAWGAPPNPMLELNVSQGAATPTLSNGGLTVTAGAPNGTGAVLTQVFFNSGKYYFEVTWGTKSTGTGHSLGITQPTAVLSEMLAGTNIAGILTGTNTNIYANDANTLKNIGTGASGVRYSFAVDLTNRLIWIKQGTGSWNADAAADPSTGVNGVVIEAGSYAPFIALNCASAGMGIDGATINYGATAFVGPVPSGFAPWMYTWTKFMLRATMTPAYAGYVYARVRVGKPNTTCFIDPRIELT